METELPLTLYPVMFVGTIAGQFVGMGLDLALGVHFIAVPLACSVLAEALAGARYGASSLGRPLSRSERRRLSIWYSVGLAALSLPLVGWLAASKASREELSSVRVDPVAVATWGAGLLVALVVYTAIRYALMAAFTRKAAA